MEKWRVIDFGKVNIRYMMAMNEAILKCDEGNTLIFWDPTKSIILGYFQKADVELNLERCKDYTIVRRTSGGGFAFSDDRGRQINYGVIGTVDDNRFPIDVTDSYHHILGILIETLREYGLNADFRPINDIIVDGKKISGNAQTRWGGKLLQHGTLLLDFDIKEMLRLTNIPLEKISDKQVASIEEGMTWMDKELPEKVDMGEVKKVVRYKFGEIFGVELIDSKPSESEEKMAQELLPKYESEKWNYRL
ncbi:MAG: lipoate--protein ligase family protein [Methanosarcinales archaeon]|nr:lipoate--protein ligase family protein [Methanosarcinales archaeon]